MLGLLGSIDLEHIQNGTTLVQADKHDLVFVPIQILKEMCIGSSGRASKPAKLARQGKPGPAGHAGRRGRQAKQASWVGQAC